MLASFAMTIPVAAAKVTRALTTQPDALVSIILKLEPLFPPQQVKAFLASFHEVC